MRTMFNLDSPIMRALAKMTNLLWLNFLTLVGIILIIPAGASLTAMSYVNIKLARDEDCYITRDFIKSFKMNFKQGTILGLLSFLVAFVLIMDYLIFKTYELPFETFLKVAIAVVAIIFVSTEIFLWPTLAKFDNPLGITIKNAFSISVIQFPKTVAIFIFYMIPAVIFFMPIVQVFPLSILFGVSVPAYWGAKMYNKFFKKLEDTIEANNASEEAVDDNNEEVEDERIFHDELDATLIDRKDFM